MTRRVQGRYTEPPASTMAALFGALGGAAAVPFYYNRLANLNRDVNGNIIQWADAIRGYAGPGVAPVLLPSIAAGFGPSSFTYDPVKGAVSAGNPGCALQGALSGAYSLSPGTPALGPTTPRIGTLWVVGEVDPASTTGALAAVVNASGGSFCALICAGGVYATENDQGTVASSAVANDGTRRVLIMTSTTGVNHGIQVPNQASVSTGGEIARIAEPYVLQVLGPALAAVASVAEVGALWRTAAPGDVARILAAAVSMHAAVAA